MSTLLFLFNLAEEKEEDWEGSSYKRRELRADHHLSLIYQGALRVVDCWFHLDVAAVGVTVFQEKGGLTVDL